MDLLGVFLYILLGGIAIISLLTFASPNLVQRFRFAIILLALVVIYMIAGTIFLVYSVEYPDYFGTLFLPVCLFWPQIIGRMIARMWIDPPIAYSKIDKTLLIFGLMGAVFMLCLTLLSMIPNRISAIDHKPVIDPEYFSSHLAFWFMTTSGIIYSLIVAFQRTILSANGILYFGVVYAWSDFQTSTWRGNPRKSSSSQLILKMKKLLFTGQINITVRNLDRQAIEDLLIKAGLVLSGTTPT